MPWAHKEQTSAAPTLDLSVADRSLLNVRHSDPTSMTLKQETNTHSSECVSGGRTRQAQ